MIVLRQSKYDVVLLVSVVLLSIAANLPEEHAFIDRNVLIAALSVIVAVCLVRYVRASLVVVTAVLVLGANLPEHMAQTFGVNQNILVVTLCAMVAVAVFNHYVNKFPSGDEPEHQAKTVYGAKALFGAVMKEDVKWVQALIRSGVKVNVRTLSGKTPLMAAAFKGNADIVQMLINAGAKANESDAEGNTALSIARHKGHSKIVAYLKMAGADEQPDYLDVDEFARDPDSDQTPYKVGSSQLSTSHMPSVSGTPMRRKSANL